MHNSLALKKIIGPSFLDNFFEFNVEPRFKNNLPVDVISNPESIVIIASLPGVEKSDIELSITQNNLTIKAVTKEDKQDDDHKVDYVLHERRTGIFKRNLSLPNGLDLSSASSTYKNGVLTLTIKKSDDTIERKIEIN